MQNNKYILAKSFVVHKDSLNILEELTDEEAGKLIKAIYKYQITGEVEKLERGLHFIFTGFVNQFKRDREKYIHKCEVNKENRAKQSSGIVTNDDESSGIVTNGTDKDSKKEKDSNSDNNKENKTDNKKNKNLKIDDCKTILSEYNGFSTEEKNSITKWIDHKYLIRNEKYVNAGWKAILKECLNQSQSGRDICHVIHKSMTSGSDGIGWQGIRFDLVDFRKKVVTQPEVEQIVQQEVVSDEVIAERKKILLAKIREGQKPKAISDDDWSISGCLQEAVENLIKDKLDE